MAKPVAMKQTGLQSFLTPAKPKLSEEIHIKGIVTTLFFEKNGPTKIKVSGHTIEYNFYCPIRKGDIISACCQKHATNGNLIMSTRPFVLLGYDKMTIIGSFIKATNASYQEMSRFYDSLMQFNNYSEAEVCEYLDKVAEHAIEGDMDTTKTETMHTLIDIEMAEKLVKWWYKERVLRRLHVLGIDVRDITNSDTSPCNLYEICLKNPLYMYSIPIEKCYAILKSMGREASEDDKLKSSIARLLYKNMIDKGFTGTPSSLLVRQFQDIKPIFEDLKSEYNLKTEFFTIYLPKAYSIEKEICDFFIRNVISTKKKIPETLTYKEKPSEDQIAAIRGALENKICIITGNPGTGKCLGFNTPVLMYNGSIIPVQDVKNGDMLMGPDSMPRIVQGVTKGRSFLYKITPLYGSAFVCNGNHILTLSGMIPFLISRKDKIPNHKVVYSAKGFKKFKNFDMLEEAIHFKNTLVPDIVDISLRDYINLPLKAKRYLKLYHTEVTFPKRERPAVDSFVSGALVGMDVYVDTILQKIFLPGFIKDKKSFAWFKNYSCYVVLDEYLNMYELKSYHDETYFYSLMLIYFSDHNGIHPSFKYGSKHVRKAFLQGFIEANRKHSNISSNGITIFNNNKKLLQDLKFIAFSLGYMVVQGTKKSILISGNNWASISTTVQQLATSIPFHSIISNNIGVRQLFSITPIGLGNHYGFELNRDGRFLLGDFLVTHNTSCLGEIVYQLQKSNTSYTVCSFTGKAVSRMKDFTKDQNAHTIHRLISQAKSASAIPYEHIIIDEASMVPMELFYKLINAYPRTSFFTFIGDDNQLQPIQWGSLFSNLILSKTIPTFVLRKNHRVYMVNGEKNGIILNAALMLTNDPMEFSFVETKNFNLVQGNFNHVVDIYTSFHAAGVELPNVVLLTPYNKTLAKANKTIQNIYNKNEPFVTDVNQIIWAVRDRVMMTKNSSAISVYNGEIGTVISVSKEHIYVDFGQKRIVPFLLQYSAVEEKRDYGDMVMVDEKDYKNVKDITVKLLIHAFILSIDKSQGSEWDFVVLFIPEYNTGNFLDKKRLYTAITRAKRAIWIVSPSNEALYICAQKNSAKRHGNITPRLQKELPKIVSNIEEMNSEQLLEDFYGDEY
jgi:hypothetical protein